MAMNHGIVTNGSSLVPGLVGLNADGSDLHQDLFSLPFRPADRIVVAWTMMDEQIEPCFQLIAGTHRSSQLQTIFSAEDMDGGDQSTPSDRRVIYEPLPQPQVLTKDRTSIRLAPGDTVLFHPLLAHGFLSGLGTQVRAIACHFASSECEYVAMSGHSSDMPTHLTNGEVVQVTLIHSLKLSF